MAQSLEKIFLQKVAQMPQEEIELTPPTQRTKAGRGKGRRSSGESVTHVTRRQPGVMLLASRYMLNPMGDIACGSVYPDK